MIHWVSSIFLLIGALFMLLAAVALVRMPDVFMRMQTNTKASTLGVVFIFLGVALHADDIHLFARAIAVMLFTFLTSPVAAHALGRASYIAGRPLWGQTVVDDLKGKYDAQTHDLAATPEPMTNDHSPR